MSFNYKFNLLQRPYFYLNFHRIKLILQVYGIHYEEICSAVLETIKFSTCFSVTNSYSSHRSFKLLELRSTTPVWVISRQVAQGCNLDAELLRESTPI